MGLGTYPASDKQFLGLVGMHGTYESNMSMYECDVMICIGARFDDRVTGKVDEFSPNSLKIHVDIDRSSINKNIAVDIPIIGDAGSGAGGHDQDLEVQKLSAGSEGAGRTGGSRSTNGGPATA